MGAICIRHPDDPLEIVYQVPETRAPWTFEQVYGVEGWVLVPDCPPVPEQARGEEAQEIPANLREILQSDKVEE